MNAIHSLDKTFVRVPLYSFNEYKEIPESIEELDVFIASLWNNDIFKEAIFLASFELYEEWRKCYISPDYPQDRKHKINYSVLKYYIRMAARSTPFGLFSGYSQLLIKNDEQQRGRIKNEKRNLERFSTLDLSFLYNVVRFLNNNSSIRKTLKFTINNSIYKIGENYRYVEIITKNNVRNHILTSLESDEVLELVFQHIKTAQSIDTLSMLLVNHVEGVNYEEASKYINILIDAQVLMSDLDICLNVFSPLNQIINFLSKNISILKDDKKVENILTILKKLQTKLTKLDLLIGNKVVKYNEIYALIDLLEIEYNKNFLINVNLKTNITSSFLQEEDVNRIKKVIKIIAKIPSDINYNSNLEKFKIAFYERYEDREMPLALVLDNEIGIGYIQSKTKSKDFSELIDDIKWINKESNTRNLKYDNQSHVFWNKLLNQSLKDNLKEIDLKNIDLSFFKEAGASSLSKTFFTIVQKTTDKIIIDSIGGNSTLNLISRFSNADSNLVEFIDQVVKIEEVEEDIIYVELLHIHNDRHGNILLREVNRQYELPFLTKSTENAKTLSIQDIYIKIINNRIVLRSKQLNKQLKIFNTTAHNYHYNSLPIYQFLCDLQYQGLTSMDLDFGSLNRKVFQFFPRVVLGKDIVLSPATWKVFNEDLNFHDRIKDLKEIKKYILNYKIPKYVYLSEGDNKLLIDTTNEILLIYIIEELKKRKQIILIECLYDLDKDYMDNETIVSFINDNYVEEKVFYKEKTKKDIEDKFIPGKDWLYYKVYTGIRSADKILIETIFPLVQYLKEKMVIKKWFFIRYNDPSFHLRIRFEFDGKIDNSIQQIMELFQQHTKNDVDNNLIWKIDLSTYERELERYEWKFIVLAENIFWYDSELIIKLINATREKNNKNILWVLSLRCIDMYFDIFNLTIKEKHKTMMLLADSFQKEFKTDKNVKKQIDAKYRANLSTIKDVLSSKERNNPLYYYILLIDETKSVILNKHKEIDKLTKEQALNLIISFIHMHVNRLIRSNPRMHELVIYGMLEKYYRMQLALKKHLIE